LGGQGGKKASARSNILELGNVIQFVLVAPSKNKTAHDLSQGREWMLLWQHKNLRYHFKKFQILYQWLNLIEKISPDTPIENYHREKLQAPLYLHLLNAIISLDQIRAQSLVEIKSFFLFRICFILGIAARTDECLFCATKLTVSSRWLSFIIQEGGFSCEACQETKYENHFFLWHAWEWAKNSNWKRVDELGENKIFSKSPYEQIKNYTAHHLNLSRDSFREE
jgi:hypothetical protein